MDSIAGQETQTDYPAEKLAEEIDEVLAHVIRAMPEDKWYRPTLLSETVRETAEGSLTLMYIGRQMVRLTILPTGQKQGFHKYYQQRFGAGTLAEQAVQPVVIAAEHSGKSVIDVARTVEEDLTGCPYKLSQLALAVQAIGAVTGYYSAYEQAA